MKTRTMQNRKERKSLVNWLDKYVPIAVKLRDGHICQRCGKEVRGFGCHWAHIYSRNSHWLRWLMPNALTLCCGCHRWFDGNGLDSSKWFTEKWPAREQYLREKRRMARSPSLDELREKKAFFQRKLIDLKGE